MAPCTTLDADRLRRRSLLDQLHVIPRGNTLRYINMDYEKEIATDEPRNTAGPPLRVLGYRREWTLNGEAIPERTRSPPKELPRLLNTII